MKLESIEAEQHLLACALIDPESTVKLLQLPEAWFNSNSSKLIYRAVATLANSSLSVDVFSVSDLLDQQKQLRLAGGMDYLVELSESLPSLSYFDSYTNTLLGCHKSRQINEIQKGIVRHQSNVTKPSEVLQWLQESVVELMTDHQQGGFENINKHLSSVIEEIQFREDNPGVLLGQKTGYDELDNAIDGFERQKIYVIAGRPGSGKTAFAVNLSLRLSKEGSNWFYFSLEMSGKSLAKRALVHESRVYNSKLRSGKLADLDYSDIAAATARLDGRTLHIDESPSLSVVQMRARLKAMQIKFGKIDGVVVDHIGLIKKTGNTDTESMNQIADDMLRLAKEFDCPLIQLCQLNRGVEGRPDKRPFLSDLKQSGKIEENADVAFMLYRADYYDKSADPYTEVNIAKNRDGETKELYYRHNLAIGEYIEVQEPPKKEPEPLKAVKRF